MEVILMDSAMIAKPSAEFLSTSKISRATVRMDFGSPLAENFSASVTQSKIFSSMELLPRKIFLRRLPNLKNYFTIRKNKKERFK